MEPPVQPPVDNQSHLPPPIISAPVHKGPKLPLPLILAGSLFIILLLLIGIVLTLRPRSSRPTSQVPVGNNTIITPTENPSSSDGPRQVSRLPLINLDGHALVLTSGNNLWLFEFTPQGPRKSLLKQIEGKVADLSVSPDKKHLAVTFADLGADLTSPQYPTTGLTVINLQDKSETEYISLGAKAVRYPVWSSDSLYLAVWNNGQSIELFEVATKTPRLEIAASGGQIGPPVFVPRKARISYVNNDTLFESDYAGVKTEITKGINPIRTIQTSRGQSQLPNPHQYSPNTNYVVFHDSLGQLILHTFKDSSRQILAEWAKDQAVAEKFSYGAPVFFDSLSNLMYYDLRKTTYQPGIDDHPLYIYKTSSKTSLPFFDNPKTPVVLVSLIPAPVGDKVITHETGFRVYGTDTSMKANCDYTGFTYAYYSGGGGLDYTSPLKVWSPDAKYIFSIGTNQVAEVSDCSVSAPFDSTHFDHAIWIK